MLMFRNALIFRYDMHIHATETGHVLVARPIHYDLLIAASPNTDRQSNTVLYTL